jgi:hypothetical protein
LILSSNDTCIQASQPIEHWLQVTTSELPYCRVPGNGVETPGSGRTGSSLAL